MTRISIATPTPSKCSSGVSARNSKSTSSRPCAGSAISSPRHRPAPDQGHDPDPHGRVSAKWVPVFEGLWGIDRTARLFSCSSLICPKPGSHSSGRNPRTCFSGSCPDARQLACHPPVLLGDRVGGGDPCRHRFHPLLGLSRRDRARLRPPSQSLSAHP